MMNYAPCASYQERKAFGAEGTRSALQMRYEQEKKDMEELRALQKKREELRVKLKEAEARYDLAMVADLKCAYAESCTAL